MEQDELSKLVTLVSALGWNQELRAVLGVDESAFYQKLVSQDPVRAYQVAEASGDALFRTNVREAVIAHTVGNTDLEATVRALYAPKSEDAPASASEPVVHEGFHIESLEDRYRIHGVQYLEETCAVDISKALLDNGAVHTPQQWVDFTKNVEWKVPSGPLYHAVVMALFNNQKAPGAAEVKEMLKTDFRKHWMITSTRVCYGLEGQGTVIHNFGYNNESRASAFIVGLDGFVTQNSGFDNTMQVLLGAEGSSEVNAAYLWLTEKQPYLWRLNTNPNTNIERALVLDGNGDRFGINAYGGIDYGRVRGMVVAAKNSLTGN